MRAAPSPVVTVAARTGFVTATAAGFGGALQPALLTGPADGPARWHRLVTPGGRSDVYVTWDSGRT